MAEREGVFIHAFKCQSCSLEFHLFSWKADRHRSGKVICPECGTVTPMLHVRTCVNESTTFELGGAREIYSLWGLSWLNRIEMNE